MSDVRAYEIVPGSLIVLRGVEFEDVTLTDLIDGLERACGHRKFVVLQIADSNGDALILGPDDLVGWLRTALGVDVELPPAVKTPTEFHGGRVEL